MLPCHPVISCPFRSPGSQPATPPHGPRPHQCTQHPRGLQSHQPGTPRTGSSLGGRGKHVPFQLPGTWGQSEWGDGSRRRAVLNHLQAFSRTKIHYVWVLGGTWPPFHIPAVFQTLKIALALASRLGDPVYDSTITESMDDMLRWVLGARPG